MDRHRNSTRLGTCSENHGDDTAAEMLGLDNSAAIPKLVENLGTGGDARAQVITLALVLGALEARRTRGATAAADGEASSSPATTSNGLPPTSIRSHRWKK
jgi:ParB family chromosome partitioning protein